MKFKTDVLSTVCFTLLLLVIATIQPLISSGHIKVMQLTVEGDVSDSFTETQIKDDLPTISGWGGYRRSTGTIVDASKWKGVHLPLFLTSLAGDSDYNISAVAIDDYSVTITRDEIEGGIRAFDELNNTLATKVIPVLAYEENDVPVSNDDGPLRLVFIGENNASILTVSPRWVKQIVTLSISLGTDESSSLIVTTTSTQTTIINSSTPTTSTIEEKTSATSGLSFGVSILVFVLATSVVASLRRKKHKK